MGRERQFVFMYLGRDDKVHYVRLGRTDDPNAAEFLDSVPDLERFVYDHSYFIFYENIDRKTLSNSFGQSIRGADHQPILAEDIVTLMTRFPCYQDYMYKKLCDLIDGYNQIENYEIISLEQVRIDRHQHAS